MGVNRLLLAQEENEAHPEQWTEDQWFRESAAGLAGRIALQMGAQPVHPDSTGIMNGYVEHRGLVVHVRDLAIRVTGITQSEASHLFSQRATLAQQGIWVRQIIDDQAMTYPDGTAVTSTEDAWADLRCTTVLRRHRRTAFVLTGGTWEATVHDTRAAAYDYATDIASCRTLTYTHYQHIWEHTV